MKINKYEKLAEMVRYIERELEQENFNSEHMKAIFDIVLFLNHSKALDEHIFDFVSSLDIDHED